MKKIFLILIPLILLSSCSIDWSGEKDAKIAELEKQIQDDTFKKKQECIELESSMREQLESPEKYGGRLEGSSLLLTEVFYSPNRNSCLYKSEFSIGSMRERSISLTINDYLTKENVYEKICDFNLEDRTNTYSKCSDEFANKLNELKGE